MWLRIAQDFTLIGTDQVLTRHRILSGSMSTDPTRMYLNRMAVLEKHLGPEPDEETEGDAVVRRAYGRNFLISCIEYLQVRDCACADRCLRKMAAVCPELLLEPDTFYLLGCGSQPKGWMGDFSSVKLDESAAELIVMLDRLFDGPQANDELAQYRRTAYANAYLSMGLLSYGAHRYPDSRRFLLRSVLASPRTGLRPHTVATMTKSLPLADQFVRQLVRRRSGTNSS